MAKKRRRKGKRAKKSTKRSAAARKAARTRAAKKARRSAAARKAARSRKRRKTVRRAARRTSKRRGHRRSRAREVEVMETPKRKRRKGKRKSKARKRRRPCRRVNKNAETKKLVRAKKRYDRLAASEGRRGRRGKRRGRRHHRGARMPNPLMGIKEFIVGILGVSLGVLEASAIDRWRAGHALQASSSAGTTTYTDSPGPGQVYDTAAPQTQLWSNWTRLVGAAVAVLAPAGIAAVVPRKHNGLKTFLQLVSLGALGRTGGKLLEDTVAKVGKNRSLVLRLYTPEVAAQAELASAVGGQLGSGQDPTKFAGVSTILAPPNNAPSGMVPGTQPGQMPSSDGAPCTTPPGNPGGAGWVPTGSGPNGGNPMPGLMDPNCDELEQALNDDGADDQPNDEPAWETPAA